MDEVSGMSVTMKELTRQLQAEGPNGLYILLGDDLFARERAIRSVEWALAGEAGLASEEAPDGSPPHLDRSVIHADEAGADGVAIAVGSSSLFGDKRLVVVRGFEKLAASEQDTLVPLLANLPQAVVVIVTAQSLDGRRKATKALQKAARIFTFSLPKGAALTRWVVDHARTVGVQLTSRSAEVLLELVPPEPQMIHTEIEKIALYAAGQKVDERMVREVASIAVPYAAERLIFRLTELIVAKETRKALAALHDLLAVGEVPLVILTMIGRQYRLLSAACGLSPVEAKQRLMQTFRLPPFIAEQIVAQARSVGVAAIAAGLRRILAADEAIKKSQEPRLTLEALVVALCLQR